MCFYVQGLVMKKQICAKGYGDGYVEKVSLQTSRSETVDWWWYEDRWLLVD